MANIPGVRITTDRNQEPAMTVTLQNGKFFKFKEYKSGLYFYDTKRKMTSHNKTITLITIPLLIIILLRPSRKIKFPNQRRNIQRIQGK